MLSRVLSKGVGMDEYRECNLLSSYLLIFIATTLCSEEYHLQGSTANLWYKAKGSLSIIIQENIFH